MYFFVIGHVKCPGTELNVHPFIYHFGRKGTAFIYPLLRKGTPFTYLQSYELIPEK